MSTVFHLTVELEDGTTWKVDADQRDFAKWELHPDGVPFHMMAMKPYATMQFLAWSAGKRAKLHHFATFEQFAEQAVLVSRQDDEDDAEDPGQPAASAGN